VTKEDNTNLLSTDKTIDRIPIPEAGRRVFWDADSIRKDKSDATRCSVITPMTEDGYKRYLEQEGVDTEDIVFVNFDDPYDTIFPVHIALYDKKQLNLLEYFEVTYKNDESLIYIHPSTGKLVAYYKSDIGKVTDEMVDMGFGDPIGRKKVQKPICTKYITNGVEILKESEVPGGMIPIIPVYGKRSFVDGVEYFEGLYQLTKDPQRLIDMMMNYMADMVAFNPVPKPEFDPREIQGLEGYHDEANQRNLTYVLRNKSFVDEDGTQHEFPLPSYTRPTEIPPQINALLSACMEFVTLNTSPGVTEDAFDTNASGEALKQIAKEIDIFSYIFLDNFAEAMRRDGQVWSAMNSEVMDTEREVTITNVDGTTTKGRVNELIFDADSGEMVKLNQVHKNTFHVSYDVGPSYQTKKEKTVQNLENLLGQLQPGDPSHQIVLMSLLANIDGQGLEDINKYARFSLLSMGLPGFEPQNDEERQYIEGLQQQAAQQANQPDPLQQLAESETIKNYAQAKKEETQTIKAAADAELSRAKTAETYAGIDANERQNLMQAMQLLANFMNMSQNNQEPPQQASL
jgi:methyl coenzyme M reductase subunit D